MEPFPTQTSHQAAQKRRCCHADKKTQLYGRWLDWKNRSVQHGFDSTQMEGVEVISEGNDAAVNEEEEVIVIF